MDHTAFKEKYKNLIYAPLNIEIPNVDVGKIIDWGLENKEEVIYNTYVNSRKKFRPNEPVFSKEEWLKRNETGFWDTFYVRINMKWLANFDKVFPEIVEFSNSLPLTALGTSGFIYQNPNDTVVDSSMIHVDENNGLGIRLALGEDVSGLYFHKLKPGIKIEDARNDFMIKNGEDIGLSDHDGYLIQDRHFVPNSNFLESEKIYAQHPNKNKQVFLLTHELAAHAVDRRKCPRVVFAWFGKTKYEERFNWKKLDQLIEESKKNNEEHFIYA